VCVYICVVSVYNLEILPALQTALILFYLTPSSQEHALLTYVTALEKSVASLEIELAARQAAAEDKQAAAKVVSELEGVCCHACAGRSVPSIQIQTARMLAHPCVQATAGFVAAMAELRAVKLVR
jgi:hypothetical protein